MSREGVLDATEDIVVLVDFVVDFTAYGLVG